MKNETSSHSEYEPSDYNIDARAVLSSFVMALVFFVSMIAAN
jgi:hypothetical protein